MPAGPAAGIPLSRPAPTAAPAAMPLPGGRLAELAMGVFKLRGKLAGGKHGLADRLVEAGATQQLPGRELGRTQDARGLVHLLPESDAGQNQIPLLFDFPFGILNVRKGQKSLLPEDEYRAARQARVRLPRPPAVRIWLQLALRCQGRLRAGLTSAALAKELGISPTRLTQILHLANLAPEIKRDILAMPDAVRRASITERRLRQVALLTDQSLQRAAFQRMRGHFHPGHQ